MQSKAFRLIVLTITLFLAAVSIFTSGVSAAKAKVGVCHVMGNERYRVISVSEKAVPAHMAHGDLGLVGVDVDEHCQPLPADSDGDGIPDGRDNCPDDPNPDQSDRYGSANGDACEDDSNGDGIPDVEETHICVSIDGIEIIKKGSAACTSELRTVANIAVAHGVNAVAVAVNGDNNTATALGVNADAQAGNGDNNTATADGDGAYAEAFDDNNTATADGDGAYASATAAGGCTAVATVDNPSSCP
jgi:hypothetical protein